MKAILRSINSFSCKLKQSNNLKYNISPKIRSNKYKSISGNGNVTIEDALNKALKDYKVYGNTYQNSTSGKNLLNIQAIVKGRLDNGIIGYETGTSDLILNKDSFTFTTNANWRGVATDYIEVEPLTFYIVTYIQPSIAKSFDCYDSNKTWLGRVGATSYSESWLKYKTLENTKYIRFSWQLSQKGTTTVSYPQIEKGEESTPYEPYTGGQPSPNPDYPQEIISCGDRTKNLWNSFNKEQTDNYKVSKDGTIQLINSASTTNGYTAISKTLKEMCPSLNVGDTVYLYIESTWYRKEIYSSSLGAGSAWTNGTSRTLTEQMLNENLILYGGYQTTSTIKIMITKNQYYDTYEPYGYKIPVNVRSENLLNTLNIPETTVGAVTYKSENGLITLSGVSVSRSIELKTGLNEPLNGQYTVIFKKISGSITNKSNVIKHRFSLGNVENPNAGSPDGRLLSDLFSSTTDVVVATGTINDVLDKISIYINPNCTFDNYTFQLYLVKGTYTTSNLPEYQPYYNETTNIYLDEPLRKIDEYNDYIDFENGKIVRNIKEVMFDGDENWQMVNTTNSKRFQVAIANIIKTTPTNTKGKIFSSHFKAVSATNTWNNIVGISYRNVTVGGFYIYDGMHDVLSEFISWLTENNIIVDYVLETPTQESITLPSIPTIDGKNIITIGTEVQGVFEAEYYSKEIIDISDYKYNLRKVED